MDFAADGEQFLGDLAAGLAGPHNQDGTVGQLFRVAVAVGMQLQDVARQLCGERRDFLLLVAAGGQHHVAGLQAALGGFHGEATAVRGCDAGDIRSCPDGCADALGVFPHVLDDAGAWHEGFRLGTLIWPAGHRERKVRRVQDERVPAVLPRTAQRGAPFQQLMFDAGLAEPVARGQTRLARADHKGVQNRSHARNHTRGRAGFKGPLVVLPQGWTSGDCPSGCAPKPGYPGKPR